MSDKRNRENTRKNAKSGNRTPLQNGAGRKTSATDAAHPMAGTSRRDDSPGSMPTLEGYESIQRRETEADVQPREDVDGRESHPIEGDKRPKRGLLSRLNPFSRDHL